MGVLEIPRKILNSYLRLVGLAMIIAYEMARRAWTSVRPSLVPVTKAYDAIADDDVTLAKILQTFMRAVMLIALWSGLMLKSLLERVTSPFRQHIDQLINEVKHGHKMSELHDRADE